MTHSDNDDEGGSNNNEESGAREDRIALLEEDVGLSEATLKTLTNQLASLDAGIESERARLAEHRSTLHLLKSRQGRLRKSVEDNARLVQNVEGAFRKCLEAYRRKMAEVAAETRASANAAVGAESSTAAASSDSRSVSPTCPPDEDRAKDVDLDSAPDSTPVVGGLSGPSTSGQEKSAETKLGHSGKIVGTEDVKSEGTSSVTERGTTDDRRTTSAVDIPIPISAWSGPHVSCYFDSNGTVKQFCPSGKRVTLETEARCWAGTIMPSIRSPKLLERIMMTEKMEIDYLISRRNATRSDGASVSRENNYNVSVRRMAVCGSCLDPVALCYRWHSPGKRRRLPWEHYNDEEDADYQIRNHEREREQLVASDQQQKVSTVVSPWLRYGKVSSQLEATTNSATGAATQAEPNAGDSANVDPNTVLCPYELMGKCLDSSCPYQHIDASILDNPGTSAGDKENVSGQQLSLLPTRYTSLPGLCLPTPSSLFLNDTTGNAASMETFDGEKNTADPGRGERKNSNGKKRRLLPPTKTSTSKRAAFGNELEAKISSEPTAQKKEGRPMQASDMGRLSSSTPGGNTTEPAKQDTEQDFLALPDISSSSNDSIGSQEDSESIGSLQGSEEMTTFTTKDRSCTCTTACGCQMPWWWCEALSMLTVEERARWTGSAYCLPLPTLFEHFGFSLSPKQQEPSPSLSDATLRLELSDSWHFLLSRTEGGDEMKTEQELKSCITFVAATLDCVRLCMAAGRTVLAGSFLRLCKRSLSVTGLEGTTKVESLLLKCLSVVQPLIDTVAGATACGIYAAQTYLLLVTEWLYSLYKADISTIQTQYECEQAWTSLLSRCVGNGCFDDDFEALREATEVESPNNGDILRALRLSFQNATRIKATDVSITSSLRPVSQHTLCRLDLFLRCASFGWQMADLLSDFAKRHDPNSINEVFVEPLWTEIEGFCRLYSKGTNESFPVPQDVRSRCGLLLLGPSHFQAIGETLAFADGSKEDARSRAALLQHDSLFYKAACTLLSISRTSKRKTRSDSIVRQGPSQLPGAQTSASPASLHLDGLVAAPLFALSASTAVELGIHAKAQLRLEKALSLSSKVEDGGLGEGLVYSELLWSQLIGLRSYFSSTTSRSLDGESPPKFTGGTGTDVNVQLLSERVISFGVYPSHVSMDADSSLLRGAFNSSYCTSVDTLDRTCTVSDQACRRIYRYVFDDESAFHRVSCSNYLRSYRGGLVERTAASATSLELGNRHDGETDSLSDYTSDPMDTAAPPEAHTGTAQFEGLNLSPFSRNGLPPGSFPCSVLLLGNTLKMLSVQRCGLRRLPETLGMALPCLRILDVSKNSLSYLPDSICNMSNLRYLDACDNALTCLPGNVGRLRCLTKLNISRNEIQGFPESICDCSNLQVINASHNKLESVPLELSLKLKELHTLNLSNNPMDTE